MKGSKNNGRAKGVTFRLVQQTRTDLNTGVKYTENTFMPLQEDIPQDKKLIVDEFTKNIVLVAKTRDPFDIGNGETVERFNINNLVEDEETGDIRYETRFENEHGEVVSGDEYDDEEEWITDEEGDYDEEEEIEQVVETKKIFRKSTTKPNNIVEIVPQVKNTPIMVKNVPRQYEISQLGDKNFYKSVLNDKFDDILNSYDKEEEEDDEYHQDEVDQRVVQDGLDDLLNNPDYHPNGYSLRTHSTFTEKEVKVVRSNIIEKINPNNVVPKDEIIEIILAAHENQSDPDTDEDILAPYMMEKEKEWDCESIISTYSNLENHPTLISEDKPNRIKLSKKTGMPLNVLPKIEKTKSVEQKESKGRKGETKEEKKMRKLKTKEEKKINRIEKKATKQAFMREEKKQQHILAIPEQQQRIVVKY